jgi:hypothetical protein
MMLRGGDDPDEDSTDDESYNDTDSEDFEEASIDEEQTKPTPREVEIAQRQVALSQQSRNFAIATALWSSLFFDSILNKAKRQYLFPAAAVGEVASNLVYTALLASGFALASSVSFVLWRDFDVRSEMDNESDNGEEIKKGDWFLSLSCFTERESNKQLVSQTRKMLYFHLAIFGLFNLGAHAGYYFSDQAPFLGLSAAAINVHNTLAVANALLKETSVIDLITQVLNWPLKLFRGGDETTKSSVDPMTFLFQLSAVAFWVRCIPEGYWLARIHLLLSTIHDSFHFILHHLGD